MNTTPIFTFVALDPRQPASQIPSPESTLGIEVTSRPLAAACRLGNVDPQHGFGVGSWDGGDLDREGLPVAACTVAAFTHWPAPGATIAFLKPDVDSVTAAAVMVLRALRLYDVSAGAIRARDIHPYNFAGADDRFRVLDGGPVQARLRLVAERDGFAPGAEWTPRPLPTVSALWPTGAAPVEETQALAPLGVICSPTREQPQLPLAERVLLVAAWLLWGAPTVLDPDSHAAAMAERADVFDKIAAALDVPMLLSGAETMYLDAWYRAEDSRLALADAIDRREVEFRIITRDGWTDKAIAMVVSKHRGAMGLGYCLAPVVVARGLAVEDGRGSKVTIAAWTARYVDFPALVAALNAADLPAGEGWGGNLTSGIIGSPQGYGTCLQDQQILDLVAKHMR